MTIEMHSHAQDRICVGGCGRVTGNVLKSDFTVLFAICPQCERHLVQKRAEVHAAIAAVLR